MIISSKYIRDGFPALITKVFMSKENLPTGKFLVESQLNPASPHYLELAEKKSDFLMSLVASTMSSKRIFDAIKNDATNALLGIVMNPQKPRLSGNTYVPVSTDVLRQRYYLNPHQADAVASVFSLSSNVTLIQGPPGISTKIDALRNRQDQNDCCVDSSV